MNAYVSFFYPLNWNVLLQPPSGLYVTKLYNISVFGKKAVMIYLPLKNPTIPNWILPCYSVMPQLQLEGMSGTMLRSHKLFYDHAWVNLNK